MLHVYLYIITKQQKKTTHITSFPIHVLETRPFQQRPGCFSKQLELNFTSKTRPTRPGFNDCNNTCMKDTSRTPRVISNVCQKSTFTPKETGSSKKFRRKESPPDSGELGKSSGLDYLRENLHAEGIPKGLQPLPQALDEPAHLNFMSWLGANELAGVVKGTCTPLDVM